MSDLVQSDGGGSGRLDLVELTSHLASQPELFGADQVPIEADTLRAARQFSVFTGTTVCRHESRALAIAALRLAGVPKREIARQLGCSRNTIDAVMGVLEERGKIEPVKERLPRLLATAAAEAAEFVRDLVADREVSADRAAMIRALGVVAGIGADKVLAASTQVSGDLHLHQHVHVNQDPVADWLRRRAESLATDSESPASPANVLEIKDASPAPVAETAVSEPALAPAPGPDPAPAIPPAGPAAPAPGAPGAPAPGGGGGGSRV